MKLAYQAATPDVRPAPGVTAYQGDLETSFSRIQQCGYDGVELMVCDPDQIDAGEIKALSRKYGLPVPMVCTGEIFGQAQLMFSSLDDQVRNEAVRRAKRSVDLASELDAQVGIGRLRGGYAFMAPPDECRRRSMDALAEVGAHALSRGVTVILEPVNSIAINFINTTQQGMAAIQEIGCPAIKLLLDSNHMFIDDKDMLASVEEAGKLISYVHLADSNRLYPGNCKLDFQAFIKALHAAGYDGWLSVEVFQRPDQDTALVKSHQHIRPMLF